MTYRNERFNRGLQSLDAMCADFDVSKWKTLSDQGAGARRIYDAVSEVPCDIHPTREELLFGAQLRLVEAGKRYLIPVLLLIVENGANRDESLWKVPRRTYFLHRQQLLDFFLSHGIATE